MHSFDWIFLGFCAVLIAVAVGSYGLTIWLINRRQEKESLPRPIGFYLPNKETNE
jgi:hypothetical protein